MAQGFSPRAGPVAVPQGLAPVPGALVEVARADRPEAQEAPAMQVVQGAEMQARALDREAQAVKLPARREPKTPKVAWNACV